MIDKDTFESEEEKTKKKAEIRAKKKRPKMKVSGKSVFKLQKIIRKKVSQ